MSRPQRKIYTPTEQDAKLAKIHDMFEQHHDRMDEGMMPWDDHEHFVWEAVAKFLYGDDYFYYYNAMVDRNDT